MTKPKEAPETAMVVSHALTGAEAELVPIHQQIATSMAQMQLNGFDSVQKCTAACWMAHGIGEHPAVFIQNHWALVIKGRLTIEPKWEYMVRKLKETVPGFKFEVIEESDDLATVKMSDGTDTHVVTYSVEDARRQGLMNANNAWGSGSTREMCFKQAVKRAARRIGVGRAAPWVEMDMPEIEAPERDAKGEAERAISGAVVVDEGPASEGIGESASAVNPASGKHAASDAQTSGTPATKPAPLTPKPERPAIMRLSDALIVKYGKQTKTVMLEKATFIYNEMVKANTGVNPGTEFKKVEDIGPVDADLMIEFLEHGQPSTGFNAARPYVKTTAGMGRLYADGSVELEKPAADEPPPAESADTRTEPDEDSTLSEDYEAFTLAIKRAKKLFGRKFLVEAPVGSKKYWFVDQATFAQAGHSASLKVMNEDGEVMLAQDALRQLTRIMIADCDAAERNGR